MQNKLLFSRTNNTSHGWCYFYAEAMVPRSAHYRRRFGRMRRWKNFFDCSRFRSRPFQVDQILDLVGDLGRVLVGTALGRHCFHQLLRSATSASVSVSPGPSTSKWSSACSCGNWTSECRLDSTRMYTANNWAIFSKWSWRPCAPSNLKIIGKH